MKKQYFIHIFFCFIFLQTHAQDNQSLNISIKDELLHLYNTEPQLSMPGFSNAAYKWIEFQKIPSDGFLSWIKNYINSENYNFRVTSDKAPKTIAFLKILSEKMSIEVPDLYLGKDSYCPYNAGTGNILFYKSQDWSNYLIKSAIDYSIQYWIVTHLEDEYKLPLLTLRCVVPNIVALFIKELIKPKDRILVYDKKIIEHFSKDTLHAILAHECGHIKNNDIAMNPMFWSIINAISFATIYHILKNSKAIDQFSVLLNYLPETLYVQFHKIGFLQGYNQKDLNTTLMTYLITQFLANNIRDLLWAHRSRSEEYQADLEAAHTVGFAETIKGWEEWLTIECDVARDFELIPSSEYKIINFLIWIDKKLTQLHEWKELNSLFRSHPTWKQRIDYLKAQQSIEAAFQKKEA